MPEHKKQHYVPRSYLKYFSSDSEKKFISLYNLKQKLLVTDASLKDQCYENYYYGKNPENEKRLSKIEGSAASAINNILKSGKAPAPNSEEHLALILFILLQVARTPSAETDSIKSFTSLIKKLIIHKNPHHKKALEETTIKISNMPSLNITSAIQSMFLLFDLKCKLFKNCSHEGFITSDHPAVKYNFLYENKKSHLTKTGFATKGLQIFLPLSSRYCLIFYDSSSYSIGCPWQRTIKIKKNESLDSINCLQLINYPQNIYFDKNISPKYTQNLINNNQALLTPIKYTLKEYPQGFHLHEKSNIFHLKVPNMKIIKNAHEAIKTSDIRNPELLKLNNLIFEDIDKHIKK